VISEIYKIDRWLIFAVIGLSFVLSFWANSVDDIVNNDGIEYIKSAHAILQGDWPTATQTYKWPFYSATIAFISLLSGLSLKISAYVVNAMSFAWVALAFVSLVRLLGGGRSALWFAALVILAFPALNKIRPFIIRDPVYIALFLSACYAFLLYLISHRPIHNILAISCFVIGSLFRVESLIFLFATQLYIFQQNILGQNNRTLGFAMLGALLFVLVFFISWWQFVPTESLSHSSILSDPILFLNEVWKQTSGDLASRLEIIESKVLVKYSGAYSLVVLFWSAISIVFLELAHTLYYLYFILWFVAWRKGLLFPASTYYRPWQFLLLTALLILFSFVLVRWFLTDRYPVTAALLLLLATPFLLSHWHEKHKHNKRSAIIFWMVFILIIASGIKSVDLSTKKHYLKDAAYWLRQNVEEDAVVYTNNRILAHYFDREIFIDDYRTNIEKFYHTIFFARDRLRHEYAAVNIKQKNSGFYDNLIGALRNYVLIEFVNEKGSRVIIFDFGRGLQDTPHEIIYSE
jgi:hypothetical protein